jgi:hypothetical protein
MSLTVIVLSTIIGLLSTFIFIHHIYPLFTDDEEIKLDEDERLVIPHHSQSRPVIVHSDDSRTELTDEQIESIMPALATLYLTEEEQ